MSRRMNVATGFSPSGDGLKGDGLKGDGLKPVTTSVAVLIAMLVPVVASACPVCFGDPNSPLSKGTSNGVLFLLGIVGFVQIGFVALFFSFWRRARALRKFKEQFHVVR